MANDAKYGTDWQDDDLDAIVVDYFAMLAADLAGQHYVKAHHCAALMGAIGRTHRSVEEKHMNISAVLDEIGLPWIPGYKPKRNYQKAILGAIDRYLSGHHSVMESVRPSPPAILTPFDIFVDAPPLVRANDPRPAALEHLVRKFDPVARDYRNRALGKAGEEFVVNLERHRLAAADRPDLARHVRWVAAEDGDGAGYDVLSFDAEGRERLIEVKTTNGAARTPFFLTHNEREVATERADDWRLYRVHLFAKEPRIFTLAPPLEHAVYLRAETWRASFG